MNTRLRAAPNHIPLKYTCPIQSQVTELGPSTLLTSQAKPSHVGARTTSTRRPRRRAPAFPRGSRLIIKQKGKGERKRAKNLEPHGRWGAGRLALLRTRRQWQCQRLRSRKGVDKGGRTCIPTYSFTAARVDADEGRSLLCPQLLPIVE